MSRGSSFSFGKKSTPGGNLLDNTSTRIKEENTREKAEAARLKLLWDTEAREAAQRLAIIAEEESARIFLQNIFSEQQLPTKLLSTFSVTNTTAAHSPTSSVPSSEISNSPRSPAK